jgi:hypothetical protein
MPWILFIEIGLVIFGLIGLISGKLSLGKHHVVRGAPARWLGAIAILPLPLGIGVGVLVGIVLVARGGGIGPGFVGIDDSMKLTLGLIEAGITFACLIAVYAIGIPIAKRQAALEERLYAEDDDDDEFDDRPTRRRRRAREEPASPPPLPAAPVAVRFPCSGCNSLIEVKPENAGRKVRCPKCQTIQRAPAEAPPAPPDAITTRPARERDR